MLPSLQQTVCVALGVLTISSIGWCGGGADTPQAKGLTTANRQLILDLHNQLRAKLALGKVGSQPSAADMTAMSWDDRVELGAQQWSEQCSAGMHNSYAARALKPFANVGQNYDGQPPSLRKNIINLGVNAWWDEYKAFTLSSMHCNPGTECGHYTQMAWANSHFVGCGYDSCPGATYARLICDYARGGNFLGTSGGPPSKPYKTGKACSKCPYGFGFCMNGALCARAKQCKNSSAKCRCTVKSATCAKHGTFDSANCECKCKNGWKGLNCEEKCFDNSKNLCKWNLKNCHVSSSMYHWLLSKCEKSCGWCTPRVDNNESNRNGIKVNLKISGGGSSSTATIATGGAPKKATAVHKKLYETKPTVPASCKKRLAVATCNGYKKNCKYSTWKHYMKNNCCGTCGGGGGSAGHKRSSCRDRHGTRYCEGRKTYCTNYHWKHWMHTYCCKTCK